MIRVKEPSLLDFEQLNSKAGRGVLYFFNTIWNKFDCLKELKKNCHQGRERVDEFLPLNAGLVRARLKRDREVF